jgi:nucleoside-diphosphate-sugar epimerase
MQERSHRVDANAILVIGGSGVVGRRLARMLAQAHPDRVVVAGRCPSPAAIRPTPRLLPQPNSSIDSSEASQPSLWMPEQIVDPDSFFARFAAAGWVVERES